MKRGQIQIGETIFVVIFILLIIILGLVFFASGKQDSLERKQDTFDELDAIVLAQLVTSLKELECSQLDVKETSCLDKVRLDAFVDLIGNDWELAGEYYTLLLGNALIVVEEVYPQQQTWVLYNYSFDLHDPGIEYDAPSTELPMKLYNAVTGEFSFGVLYITRYNRE